MDALNLGLAFLEGLAIIISPCVLPVLPILLASGIEGGRLRPYGLILGFIAAFSLFTLLSRQLVQSLGIDAEVIRQISFYVLILFGLTLLSETLSEYFDGFTQRLSDLGQSVINRQRKNNGFWSGLLVGSAIGLVWTPCAGPILTAVIVQAIRQETDLQGVLTVLAFGCGAALPMFIITLQGNKLMSRLAFLKRRSVLFRKVFGVLIIATVLLTAQGTLFNWNFSLAGQQAKVPVKANVKLTNGLTRPYAAPELRGLTDWINSRPLTLQSLKGKVVLIDFWTYSCINCVRTLPYITTWDKKYRNKGLVIIGVHAPEFEFEKKADNVKRAVAQHHIQYPVALDNHLDTWTNFQNRYWPAHYLIDRQGRVVYTHFGEGEYTTTEGNIRALLGVGQFTTKDKPLRENAGQSLSLNQTPETYLGYGRAARYSGSVSLEPDQISDFNFAPKLPLQHWSLKGKWFVDAEKIIAQQAGASLRIHFWARKVFLVMGVPPGKSVAVKVLLNGTLVKMVTVNQHTLYTLLSLDKGQPGTLELQAVSPGLSAYAFTFGS